MDREVVFADPVYFQCNKNRRTQHSVLADSLMAVYPPAVTATANSVVHVDISDSDNGCKAF